MKLSTKILSVILVISIVFGYLPPHTFAASSDETEVANSDTTIQGENTIGDILSEDIQEAQQTQITAQNSGAILDVTVEGQIAIVEYSFVQEAVLYVGFYTEDARQLLSCCRQKCPAGESSIQLTIPDTLPQYFYISAYILDPISNKPLCPAYRNPMYTQSMQELMDSSIDDYDPELVLNLDNNNETNFIVFNENTISIEPAGGHNIVRSIDDQAGTYIIENADHQFTDLLPGQVIRYPYGENEILIVKVNEISVSGTTVTIFGRRPETQEVFQAVKLESSATEKDCIADPDFCDDGVTYIEKKPATRASGTEGFGDSFPYSIDKEITKGPVTVSINGTIAVNIGANIDYYLTIFYHYIRFTADIGIQAELTISGKLEWSPKVFRLNIPLLGVLSIGIEGSLQFKAETEGKFSAGITQTIGFIYDNGERSSLSTDPKFANNSDISLTISLGLSLGVNIQLLDGLAKVGISAGVEFKVQAAIEDGPAKKGGRMHYCASCLNVTIDLNFKLWIDLELFWGVVDEDFLLVETSKHLCDFYYSFDLQQGGFGKCPNVEPMLIIQTVNAKGSPISASVEVSYGDSTYSLQTSFMGLTCLYVPAGRVYISAIKDDRKGFVAVDVTESQWVTVALGYQDYIGDIKWALDADGSLTITGSGNSLLPRYDDNSAPWNKYNIPITSVNIKNCIIADDAFSGQNSIISANIEYCTLGKRIFKDCTGLKTVIIAESTTIGESAFEGCTGLTYVSLPKSSCTVGSRAFAACSSLESISLNCPDMILENSVFEGCSSLKHVFASNLNLWLSIQFSNETANPLYYAGELYVGRNLLTNLNLAEYTEIPDYAFAGCTSLRTISRHNNLRQIGKGAFYGCSELTNLDLYDKLTLIGDSAFANCESLTEVFFHGDPPSIAENAFSGVTATARHLDSNANWLESHRSSYGGDLTWETFLKTIASGSSNSGKWVLYDNYTLVISGGQRILVSCEPGEAPWSAYAKQIRTVIIEEGVTEIGHNLFRGLSALTSVQLPDSLTYIGAYAFAYCSSLSHIDLPSNVKNIWTYAFAYCSNLEQITLPNTLTIIGAGCFEDTNIHQIDIPSSVTFIGMDAFCTKNGGLIININDIASWCNIEFKTAPFAGNGENFNSLYLEGKPVYTLTLPDNVTAISQHAFAYLQINKVILGQNVQTIANNAFSHSSVKYISLNSGLQTIGDYAFYNCDNLTEVNVPNTVNKIGMLAFGSSDNLKRIYIPESVTSVGGYVLSGCEQLTTVYYLASTGVTADSFRNCRSLIDVTLGDSVTSIGAYAFYGCVSLTELEFGKNITYIGDSAFDGCNALEYIHFGDSLKTIYKNAFINCDSIAVLDFPATLELVYTTSFVGLDNLESIYFRSENAPTVQVYNLDDSLPNRVFYNNTATIYYPETGNWTEYATRRNFGEKLTWCAWNPEEHTLLPADFGDISEPEIGLVNEALAFSAYRITKQRGILHAPKSLITLPGTSVCFENQAPTADPSERSHSFDGLSPEQEYVLFVVFDANQPDPFETSNLLYMDQGKADINGTLSFQYRVADGMPSGYPLIFGGGRFLLTEANITIPEVFHSEDPMPIHPTVEYNGATLTEGVDYILSGDLVYSNVGEYFFTLNGINDYCGTLELRYLVNNSKFVLVTAEGTNGMYEDLNAAMGACTEDCFVQLTDNLTENLTVSCNSQLDLNGYTLTGDVTIADNATLYIFDSATADFTSENRGKLIGSVKGNLSRTTLTSKDTYGASYKYLTLLEEENTYSFHRIYLSILALRLTPYRDTGSYIDTDLNYKASFQCNDLVAKYVTGYGADFSIDKTVSLDFLADRDLKTGPEASNERVTNLRGALRSTYSIAKNMAQSIMTPKVQLYIRLNDGLEEQVNANTVQYCLKDVIIMVAQSNSCTIAQETALAEMYNLHRAVIDPWGDAIASLQAYSRLFGSCATVTWQKPLTTYHVTVPFGPRLHLVSGTIRMHYGVDLAASSGTPIYAVRDGVVTTAAYNSSDGYYVVIDHGDQFLSRYQYMTYYIVKNGQTVSAGQVIGYVGSYLHLGIYYKGTAVNPAQFIDLY